MSYSPFQRGSRSIDPSPPPPFQLLFFCRRLLMVMVMMTLLLLLLQLVSASPPRPHQRPMSSTTRAGPGAHGPGSYWALSSFFSSFYLQLLRLWLGKMAHGPSLVWCVCVWRQGGDHELDCQHHGHAQQIDHHQNRRFSVIAYFAVTVQCAEDRSQCVTHHPCIHADTA